MAAPRTVNVVVLAGLLFATWMNWSWPWGVLFISWTIPSIRYGEAYLIGPVPRDEQPVVFWTVTGLWVFFGVLAVMVDAAPDALGRFYQWMWGF